MEILIIEDDSSIAEVERDFLEMNGFTVTLESDGKKGMDLALSGKFNLILLDLMLPGKNGYEICRLIRTKIDVPILMVSAKGEDGDKVRGLGLGADDYIAKPFSPTELVARVKSHIAQYERLKAGNNQNKTDDEITIGDVLINPKTRRVFIADNEIILKNKEYDLLYFLASNPEMVFSKEHLYEKIWGADTYGDIKTVAVHINRLREKTEKDPTNPKHIQTVWGSGYRFMV
ncbi:DNA-binding response regulator [Spirochaetia bacterium]|nr:DNA-binding response regulator [Spirochaetia bacterium]GHV91296.1 DNA-binding response regulator [Spirochaetia bacterium]